MELIVGTLESKIQTMSQDTLKKQWLKNSLVTLWQCIE